MLRALYDWTIRLAARPRATYILGAIAFAECSFFPIPSTALFVPMALAERSRTWFLAFICTVMSGLGALFGYFIGSVLFEEIARPILAFYGYGDEFADFAVTYNEWGAWIVILAGITPFPFKVVTIASGATGMNVGVFVLCSILARGSRFYAVAALLYWFGSSIRDFIEKRLVMVFTLGCLAIVGAIAAARLLT